MRSQGIVHAINDGSFDDLVAMNVGSFDDLFGGALSGTLSVHGVSLQTCHYASR